MIAVIEIPLGSLKKFEIKDGEATLDRDLPIPCPAAYGFIPGTLEKDGDPVDIFVISNKLHDTFDEVEVKIIGKFICQDQGIQDDKFLACRVGDHLKENEILSNMVRIGHYLMNYKPGFKVLDYKVVENEEVEKYRRKYNESKRTN